MPWASGNWNGRYPLPLHVTYRTTLSLWGILHVHRSCLPILSFRLHRTISTIVLVLKPGAILSWLLLSSLPASHIAWSAWGKPFLEQKWVTHTLCRCSSWLPQPPRSRREAFTEVVLSSGSKGTSSITYHHLIELELTPQPPRVLRSSCWVKTTGFPGFISSCCA